MGGGGWSLEEKIKKDKVQGRKLKVVEKREKISFLVLKIKTSGKYYGCVQEECNRLSDESDDERSVTIDERSDRYNYSVTIDECSDRYNYSVTIDNRSYRYNYRDTIDERSDRYRYRSAVTDKTTDYFVGLLCCTRRDSVFDDN